MDRRAGTDLGMPLLGTQEPRARPRLCSLIGATGVGVLLLVSKWHPSGPTSPVLMSDMHAASTNKEPRTCSNGFPKGFMWGVGTAAYQIEGGASEAGRTPSIWDVFSHLPGKTYEGQTGDVADDHFHRWRSDIHLMQSIGVRNYRLSLSWSRVMSWDPASSRMVPNEAGITFYNQLLDGLVAAGIQPHVTLYHWDLPQALDEHKGGWHTPDNELIMEEFETYARLCFERFASKVATWWTFNEPWTFAVSGYSMGNHAPGCAPAAEPGPTGCPNGDTIPYIVAHNVLNSHARAVAAYRSEFQKEHGGRISITLPCEISLPLTKSAEDAAAAERANEFWLGWWLQPLVSGEYPAVMREYVGSRLPTFSAAQRAALIGSIDVLSLNHYSTHLVRAAADGEAGDTSCGWMADQKLYVSFAPEWPQAASPWQHANPAGIRLLLQWAARRWHGDLYITENGWSCHSMDAEAAAHDHQQTEYFAGYTAQVARAIREGLPVKAYFAWSLYDNYEWADGYSKRFGLFFNDYGTQTRTPKAAARWWNTTARDC